MSVAAKLDLDAAFRAAREIGGLDVGGAAVEGEWRHGHAPVADRDQRWLAIRGLLFEQLDGVATVARRRPVAVARARRLGACRHGAHHVSSISNSLPSSSTS